MKVNNLSISIPNKGCKKNCLYCVSRMTGYMTADESLFIRNLTKARRIADRSQVSSVSITGKGEPMLNADMVREVVREFVDFPVELQTCGLELADDTSLVDLLTLEGVDIFALSFDRWSDFESMKYVIERINCMNRTVRVTMNVSDMLVKPFEEAGSRMPEFMDYISECKKYGIQQFSFRNLSIPTGTPKDNKTAQWIEKHVLNNKYYQDLIHQFECARNAGIISGDVFMIRDLNYGARLYDVEGISFTYFDYCVQDLSRNSEDIRSLIYQEDGHMYTTWNSLAGRIF